MLKVYFLHLFPHSHKCKIVVRYFTENESYGFHDIEAFVVYKCELCGDTYESKVYSAKKVCSEYSLKQIKNNYFCPITKLIKLWKSGTSFI